MKARNKIIFYRGTDGVTAAKVIYVKTGKHSIINHRIPTIVDWYCHLSGQAMRMRTKFGEVPNLTMEQKEQLWAKWRDWDSRYARRVEAYLRAHGMR